MESNADQGLHNAQPPAQPRKVQQLTGRLRFENLRLSHKLALVAGTFAIPIAAQFALLAVEHQKAINVIRLESTGSAVIKPLNTLMIELEHYSDALINSLAGGPPLMMMDMHGASGEGHAASMPVDHSAGAPIADGEHAEGAASTKGGDSDEHSAGMSHEAATHDAASGTTRSEEHTGEMTAGHAEAPAAMMSAQANSVGAALNSIVALAHQHPELGLTEDVQRFEALLKSVQGQEGNLTVTEAVREYTDVVQTSLADLIRITANNSKLTLDSELHTYYTQDLIVTKLPEMRRLFAQMHGTVLGSSSSAYWTPEVRSQLLALQVQSQRVLEDARKTLEYARQARPALENTLVPATEEYIANVEAFLDETAGVVRMRRVPASKIEQVNRTAHEVVLSSVKVADIAQRDLDGMLKERITGYQSSTAVTFLAILALVALASWLLLVFSRAITRPLGELATAARRLGEGDLEAHVQPRGSDEVAVVGRSFNDAVLRLRAVELKNAEGREEAQRLQQSVDEYLDVTMNIAEGDLTARGRVSGDVLGSVVDATNVALDQIARVLREVQAVANQVQGGASQVAQASGVLSSSARDQAEQAKHMQMQTMKFTEVFRDTATQIAETAKTAEQALAASQSGQAVVQDTQRGLEVLRGEMQEISGGMAKLLERSTEISEIAETITTFASQTTLLALGASLEAAGAGEAGKRFMVVAEGVRQLADDSAQAAYRVESVVKTVQAEIQRLSSRVSAGARSANEGYEVASRAGELLREIESLVAQSAQVSHAISTITREQVDDAELVSHSVQSITLNATQTQSESERSLRSAETLSELARQLSAQLARFRLS